MSKLKPCPFCGGTPTFIDVSILPVGKGSYVLCPVCRAEGPMVLYGEEGAIASWNTRAEDQIKVDPWIATADRLPRDSERVLVTDSKGRISLGSYHCLYSDGTIHPIPFWRDRDCGDGRMKVTHWMSLDAIAKAKGK